MNAADILAAFMFPVTLWVLWRLQALAVEGLRWSMAPMVRFAGGLHNAVSFFGVLLHELSHAAVLAVTGHGVKKFHVRPDHGHVLPRRRFHNGFGDLAFMAAAFAPMFVVPAAALAAFVFLLDVPFPYTAAGNGWEATTAAAQAFLIDSTVAWSKALASVDLYDPRQAALVLVLLLAAPGMRPSLISGKGIGGKQGDIAIIRTIIRHRPLPFLLLLAVVIGLHFLVPFAPAAYWAPVQVLWSVAVVGILTSLLGAVVWGLVAVGSRIVRVLAWVPPVLFVAAQVLGHNGDMSIAAVNGLSLLIWAVTALGLRASAPRRSAFRF